MKYFSNLKNGWANLTIGDFSCRCSYIQNVPIEILSAYDEFKQKGHCIITIDSEGYEHEIIVTELGVHALTYRDRIHHFDLTKNFNTYIEKTMFLKDLFKDIAENIDVWAKWMCITDPNSDCYEQILNSYKNDILKYVKKYANDIK